MKTFAFTAAACGFWYSGSHAAFVHITFDASLASVSSWSADCEVAASWSGQDVAVTITDDGPGFAPEIMDRIGEPYVTSRRQQRQSVDGEASGLGLGFFIAKTLLERSGATLDFENRAFPDRGAVVRVHWGRSDFERPMAFAS